MRYEIRMGEDDPDELAAARAIGEAELFLRTMGFGYRCYVRAIRSSSPSETWRPSDLSAK
jgi:hypothetical protein